MTGPQTSVVIADQLRELIVDGTYAPGEQVSEASLTAQLRISRGPVREALQRLAQEGLLVSHRNRGVFVVELTDTDIAEIYAAREAIELAAARVLLALPARARSAVAARLRAIADAMPPLVAAGDWSAVAAQDLAFHEGLVAATGNSRLIRIYSTLAAESRICMAHLRSAYARPEALAEEHVRLVDLLAAGAHDELCAAITTHLSTAVADLTAMMSEPAR
ncbi:GntR family transcriptional regulator [Tomitella biformata]|uniref:GntR family transcriptional regulator n=1 Tax=Tomitella biformata TaxID=630403 RepID=UPI0004AFF74D|nr:GntR family transcriptional regulator [Tomitella biformata]